MANKQIRKPFNGEKLESLLNDYRLTSGEDALKQQTYDFTYENKRYTGVLNGKISARFLAKAVNTNETYLRKCIKDNLITEQLLNDICKFLNISTGYLTGESYSLKSFDLFIKDIEINFRTTNPDEALQVYESRYKNMLNYARDANRIDSEGTYIDIYFYSLNELYEATYNLVDIFINRPEFQGGLQVNREDIKPHINDVLNAIHEPLTESIKFIQYDMNHQNYINLLEYKEYKEGKDNGKE